MNTENFTTVNNLLRQATGAIHIQPNGRQQPSTPTHKESPSLAATKHPGDGGSLPTKYAAILRQKYPLPPERQVRLGRLMDVLETSPISSSRFKETLKEIAVGDYLALAGNFNEFCTQFLRWPDGAGARFMALGDRWTADSITGNGDGLKAHKGATATPTTTSVIGETPTKAQHLTRRSSSQASAAVAQSKVALSTLNDEPLPVPRLPSLAKTALVQPQPALDADESSTPQPLEETTAKPVPVPASPLRRLKASQAMPTTPPASPSLDGRPASAPQEAAVDETESVPTNPMGRLKGANSLSTTQTVSPAPAKPDAIAAKVTGTHTSIHVTPTTSSTASAEASKSNIPEDKASAQSASTHPSHSTKPTALRALVATNADSDMTDEEREILANCELVIERSGKTFVEVGMALATIREQRLYRTKHASFEAYCRQRWEFGRARAAQLIGSAKAVQLLTTVNCAAPTSERQVRPLVGLKEDEQKAAWQNAVDSAPEGNPTSEHVIEAVNRLKEGNAQMSERPTKKRSFDPDKAWCKVAKMLDKIRTTWPDDFKPVLGQRLRAYLEEHWAAAEGKAHHVTESIAKDQSSKADTGERGAGYEPLASGKAGDSTATAPKLLGSGEPNNTPIAEGQSFKAVLTNLVEVIGTSADAKQKESGKMPKGSRTAEKRQKQVAVLSRVSAGARALLDELQKGGNAESALSCLKVAVPDIIRVGSPTLVIGSYAKALTALCAIARTHDGNIADELNSLAVALKDAGGYRKYW